MTATPASWDPGRYLAFAGERGRPFVDLVARIDATDPSGVPRPTTVFYKRVG